MKRAVLALALIASPVQAEQLTKLQEALLVEWMVANCDVPDEYVFKIMQGRMVIDGSKPEEVAEVRKIVQHGMATEYKTVADGCQMFRQAIKKD